MRPKLVAQAIRDGLNADGSRLNYYIWGQAGVGKSAVCKQVADEAGVDFIDIRAAQLDPTDMKGIIVPDMVHGVATWLAPEWLPKDPAWRGIIMLDEFNLAPILVQSAGYELIWDRSLGDYELPKGAMVIAAGNRKEDGAPAHNMPAPLRNRFIHLVFSANIDDWVVWAMSNDIHPDVIGFLNWKAELFAPVFNAKVEEQAFPSPRSWEFVSKILSTKPNGSPNYFSAVNGDEYINEMLRGAVGSAAQAEFSAYQRVRESLPDINAILAGNFPKEVSSKVDVRYALTTTLAVKALQTDTSSRPKVYDNVLNFLESRLKSPEFETLCVRMISTKDRETLAKTPAWGKWIKKNQKIFL